MKRFSKQNVATIVFSIVLLAGCSQTPPMSSADGKAKIQESSKKSDATLAREFLEDYCGSKSVGGMIRISHLYDRCVFENSDRGFDGWNEGGNKCLMTPQQHSQMVSMISGLEVSKLDRSLYDDVVIPCKRHVFAKYMIWTRPNKALKSDELKKSAVRERTKEIIGSLVDSPPVDYELLAKEFYDCLTNDQLDVVGRKRLMPDGIVPAEVPEYDPNALDADMNPNH